MKRMRNLLFSLFLLTIVFATSHICQAKTITALKSTAMSYSGGKLFYIAPHGRINCYTPSTGKKVNLRGTEGTFIGYSDLIAKGNFLYATLWVVGDDDYRYDLYRMTLTGKSRKKLASNTRSSFAIAGNKIYYQASKNGKYMSMKLDGSRKKNEKILTIKQADSSAGFYTYYDQDNKKFKVGSSIYQLSDGSRILKRNGKTIYSMNIPGEISCVYAQGKSVLIEYMFYSDYLFEDYYDRGRLVYMDWHGNHKKILHNFELVN